MQQIEVHPSTEVCKRFRSKMSEIIQIFRFSELLAELVTEL